MAVIFDPDLVPKRAYMREERSPFADVGDVWAFARAVKPEAPPDAWEPWLQALFPATFTAPLAPYQREFWDWVWASGPTGAGPDGRSTYVMVWPRGWAKSTHAEIAVLALAAHSRRRYGWYVCSRQAQADDHVVTIAGRLRDSRVASYYPLLSQARVDVLGAGAARTERSRQLAWRRNRLWTADGAVVDALGLDSAVRGAKLGDQRPDFMVFDDVDEELDAEGTLERKIAALTRRIIPAAAPWCLWVVAQNLVHPRGLVTRLVDGTAQYLGSRTVSGPVPAIEGLTYEGSGTEARITGGVPTWELMGLEVCQRKIEAAGIDAFLSECQHELSWAGEPRFDRDALAIHALSVREPLPPKGLPAWAQGDGVSVWSLPIAGEAYAMYFDGAEGVGRDYCVTCVVRVATRGLVAMVRDNRREQREHAGIAAELWRQYGRGLVGWERSHEADFAAVMAAEGVDRVYEHEEERTLAQRMNGVRGVKRRGYPARQRERRQLVARLARYIDGHEGELVSRVLLEEARAFVVTSRQPDGEAGVGSHDDALFAFGGALLMADRPEAQRLEMMGEARGPRTYRWGQRG